MKMNESHNLIRNGRRILVLWFLVLFVVIGNAQDEDHWVGLKHNHFDLTFYSISSDSIFDSYWLNRDTGFIHSLPDEKGKVAFTTNAMNKSKIISSFAYCYTTEITTRNDPGKTFYLFQSCEESYLLGVLKKEDLRIRPIDLNEVTDPFVFEWLSVLIQLDPNVFHALHYFKEADVEVRFDENTYNAIIAINRELRPYYIDSLAWQLDFHQFLLFLEKCENGHFEQGEEWLDILFRK